MNDEDLKKMMSVGIPPATELVKRRTLKEAAGRFAKAKPVRFSGRSASYRLAALSLTAIAMFTVLSYAVTQSSRSGGGDAGKETNLVNSTQLTQYPAGIRTAIVRMIIGGAATENIRFNTPAELSLLTDQKNAVFSPQGGGANYTLAPVDVMANNQPGEWLFNMELALEKIGTADRDVVAYLPGISETVCKKLNDELGLPEKVPYLQSDQSALYMKRMVNNYLIPSGQPPALDSLELAGQPFGCFLSHDGQTYVYYHVLLER